MITHIGLAGCGNWGRFILRDLKSLGCRVTVAARSTRSRAFAAEFGADHVVPSIGELPSGADGFVVATPTALHHEAVSALLAFGRPVFVEKPLTNDLDSARDLESRAPGRIFVMDKWRYHPGVEALRDLARSQELGPVRYIQTLRLGWSNPHEVDASWILLPHDLAITLEILGYIPEPVSAFAEYQCSSLSGMSGVLGRDPAVSVEVSAARASTLRRISVCFERGAAVLEDSYSPAIRIRRLIHSSARKDDPEESRPLATELPLVRELRAFVDYLRGGPPPRSSAADAVRIVEVISGLRRLADVKTS